MRAQLGQVTIVRQSFTDWTTAIASFMPHIEQLPSFIGAITMWSFL